MQVSFLIVQLALFFIPGLIWNYISIKYSSKIKPSDSSFIIQSFIFGAFTYLCESMIMYLFHKHTGLFEIPSLSDGTGSKTLTDSFDKKVFLEVIFAIPLSFLFSIIDLYLSNYKVFPWFLQKIGATKKYGDEDIWDFVFNSSTPGMEWVNIRDFDNKVIFTGSVRSFSETEKTRELFLIGVIVYDFDGIELYRTPQMYISRPTDSTIVEFPAVAAVYSDEPSESPPPEETSCVNQQS